MQLLQHQLNSTWKLSCRGRATRPPNYSSCGNELGREGRLAVATQLFHQKSSFGSGIYYYGSCGKSRAAAAITMAVAENQEQQQLGCQQLYQLLQGQIGLQKLHFIGAANCNNSNHDSCCCNCNKSSSLSRTGKSPLPGHQFLIGGKFICKGYPGEHPYVFSKRKKSKSLCLSRLEIYVYVIYPVNKFTAIHSSKLISGTLLPVLYKYF
jgi:hypothetical protein